MARRKKAPQNPELELPQPPEMDEELLREEEDFSEEEPQLSPLEAVQESQDELESTTTDVDDIFGSFAPDDEEDGMEWNDPNVTHLDSSPALGGRPAASDLFGEKAIGPAGRSTSPRLYSQAANFPTCSQLRVWKYERGIPVGMGVIASQASEEDLIDAFRDAMPKPGEGRCQFKLRPIDLNGAEMGQEINLMISEHHADLQRHRNMHVFEDNSPDEATTAASEMTRMFERMMLTGEQKTRALEHALEDERERLRIQDANRAEERVSLANEAAKGIQILSERMMQDESRRNADAIQVQQDQNQTMITTLTSIFAQQQTMMQSSMEASRRSDEYRLEQERQRAARERDDAIARRERERRDSEERLRRERDEAERKMLSEREQMQGKIHHDQKEMEFKLTREREEAGRTYQREKEERESRDRWLHEERTRRDQIERETAQEREADRQRRHERLVADAQSAAQRDREHAERMMALSKIEMDNKTFGGLGELIPKASGFLKQMGVDPSELVQRVLAPPDEGSGTTELITSLLGVAGEVAKTAIASKHPHMSPMAAPPLLTHDPHTPTPPPPPLAAYPMPGPVNSSSAPVQTTPATGAGLALQDQKNARLTLRKLIQILESKPIGEWDEIIMQTLAAQPIIYEYCQAVTVRSALYECGASDHAVLEIVQRLRDSPLVPPNLAYGD